MTDKDGCNALMHAANANNDHAVITFLINEGIDVDARDNNDYAAMGNNNPEVMKSLIDAGAGDLAVNPEREELSDEYHERGNTALMLAAKHNTPEVVNVLINAGANLNMRDISVYGYETCTPLEYAAQYNTLTVVQTLIDAGAQITNRALDYALEGNTEDVAQFLAGRVDGGINYRMDFFVNRIRNNNDVDISNIVNILPDSDIYIRDNWGNTLLLRYINGYGIYCRINIVTKLLKAGIDVNAQNDEGKTALMIASSFGDFGETINIINILLDYGSNVDMRDNNGETALIAASKTYLRAGIIKILLDHGANADIRDNDGKCTLDYAKNTSDIDFINHREALKRLISATKITSAPILSLKIALKG